MNTNAAATATALSALPAPDRAAVVLIYFHGLTQAQAAAALGVPTAEVRCRVARALLDLGRRLRVPDGAARRIEQTP